MKLLKFWIVILLAGGVLIYFFYPRLKTHPSLPAQPEERQEIPSPPVLDMPAAAPLPVAPFQSRPANPSAKPPESGSANQSSAQATVQIHTTPEPPKLNPWQVIDKYRQVIALDDKYYQIALESDRDGYVNQAILYYKKYLFVAPTGPHSGQVRQRLAQLESSK